MTERGVPEDRAEATVPKIQREEQSALEEWDRYVRAKDLGHEKYMARARKQDDFYRGEQWDPADKAKLDKQGKPALTINQVFPTINAILGEQITRRADLRFKPAKDGSEEVATVISKVIMQILYENDFDSKESEAFADGIIEERGYYDIRMEFDENLQGSATITVEDPKDVIPDPYGKDYDPATWQEVTKTRWWSLDEVELEYGKEQRNKVEHIARNERTRGEDSFRYETSFSDDDAAANSHAEWWGTKAANRQVRSVRVIERQFYQNTLVYYFVDPATGDSKKAPPGWNREQRRAFASKTKLFLHQKQERRIRWRVSVDKVLLHDDWSPYNTFTIIPYFAFFRRGRTMSAVTNLISPQENLNKLSSQELHIVNSTANSGWITEVGSLSNMTAEELASKGAETGLVIEKNAGRESPEKIKPNTVPSGIDRISQKAHNNIRQISGINDGMLGLESAEVSGVALASKEKRAQIQIQVPMENLARTRKLVARKLLELLQQFYTEPRLMKITRPMPKPGESEVEEVEINTPSPEGHIINDITVGKYEVVVSSQPSRDTFNDSQFAEAMSLVEIGIPIPPDRIIEYSNLADKHALAEEVRAMTGRGEPTEEELALQQQIQQMELMTMQLNLAKLEGEAMKVRAEAQKLLAESGAIPVELELQMVELEADIQKEREGFEVRKELALTNARNQLEKVLMQAKAKQLEQTTAAALAPRTPVRPQR
ncbi:portal protein [Kineobactrum salinum]|uniref:Genomic island protein n=1 Tax=Kineobactrum salinum TaxID=2708301 RepID=A0A6C0U5Q3_9GAMM|nr:hypothetical protein [Kineobactrum salinum]QIB67163.1 hypothetical protein G3T16_18900 [Kineobactrum salinum]